MKQLVKNSKGFTLMEVLIVVIVLGILAGLAVPIFTKTTNKAVKAEALSTLTAIRGSMMRFGIEKGVTPVNYKDATVAADGLVSNTDFDWRDSDQTAGGQETKFIYKVIVAASPHETYVATATRKGDTGSTVTINQAGCVSGTGVFQAPAC